MAVANIMPKIEKKSKKILSFFFVDNADINGRMMA